jgi:PAS domain S-box-containing protein
VADPSQEDTALERKLADDALRASEARYRRLFETAQDGILILDGHSGLITDVNPFLISLLDYPRGEFIGKTLWDIGPFKQIQVLHTLSSTLERFAAPLRSPCPRPARG